jgi:hypothetical protein
MTDSIRYVLQRKVVNDTSRWTLMEYQPGEDPNMVAQVDDLTSTAVTEWANAQIGSYVELDWKSGDGSVLTDRWTAQVTLYDD